MDILQKQAQLIEEFSFFDDWADKYQHLIEIGEMAEKLPNEYKIEMNRVRGCQSQVWLISEFKDGKVLFRADSDSSITRGLIQLLVNIFSGETPSAIVHADLNFIEKIGLGKHLSSTRANGFASMIEKLRQTAAAYGKL